MLEKVLNNSKFYKIFDIVFWLYQLYFCYRVGGLTYQYSFDYIRFNLWGPMEYFLIFLSILFVLFKVVLIRNKYKINNIFINIGMMLYFLILVEILSENLRSLFFTFRGEFSILETLFELSILFFWIVLGYFLRNLRNFLNSRFKVIDLKKVEESDKNA